MIPKAILKIERNEDIYLIGWLRGYFSKDESKFKIGELSFNELNSSLRKKEFFIKESFQELIDVNYKSQGLWLQRILAFLIHYIILCLLFIKIYYNVKALKM